MKNDFALKGNICHTPHPSAMKTCKDGYVVCVDGICEGVFPQLPEEYASLSVTDCSDALIIPGMTDLHLHAPQFAFRGMGMDQELLDWLLDQAFPEEKKFEDPAYASLAYGIFADAMKQSATTRAVIFGTMHREATLTLMDCMESTGLISLVGKVNMDLENLAGLKEADAGESVRETIRWLDESAARGYERTGMVITPRFIPSCSAQLLRELGRICREYGLPVQSHLSENISEVEWVQELMPESAFYGDAYDRFGLFGRDVPTVMAHCVYSGEEEMSRIRENGVWVAVCSASNANLRSGIAPVRRYLDRGLRMGLGSDVAGGQTESMFRAVTDTIQMSKMFWRCVNQEELPLTFSEAFYLATKGGGSFFGQVGSFEKGSQFDAVVIDDGRVPHPQKLTVAQRLERAVYLGLDRDCITAKYVRGRRCV